ncbi:MAG: VWA domain-containing protein [Candidatus Jordarchaeum sp.]|uniref:VWA domain-containing protein n=1 Tax=Candidatus Jordarchaeum sp. TaxID=2823881 RepID=UPI0040495846
MPVRYKKLVFPFTAIVGQTNMKLGLILNVIDPKIGGVLIRGEKGTGKSTAVRALAALLPEMEFIKNCPFNCDPKDPTTMCELCKAKVKDNDLDNEVRRMRVVEIPLGATEDRVVGSLDIERAIKEGVKALEPGILAEANRQILYVDEINLLSDHIVDDLLDAAAFGINTVEREGVSVSHPSSFVLVGSMNPEEGELRPQILDRIGLQVQITPLRDPRQRLEILTRIEEFDNGEQQFIEKWQKEEDELQKSITNAKKIVHQVKIPEYLLITIVKMCLELDVGTHRGDITVMRCAKALAALDGRLEVNEADVLKAAELALGHRIRKFEFEEAEAVNKRIAEGFEKALNEVKQQEAADFFRNDAEMNGQQQAKGDEASGKTIQNISFDESLQADSTNQEFPYQDLWNRYMQQQEGRDQDGMINIRDPRLENLTDEEIEELRKAGILGEFFKRQYKSLFRKDEPRFMGRRIKTKGTTDKGRYIYYKIPKEKTKHIALDASIRASSPHQKNRKNTQLVVEIQKQDIREKIFEYRAPLSIVFVLDASGSMFKNLKKVKQVILSLHDEAYHQRDRVGLVVFKGYNAAIMQYPTVNLQTVSSKLLTIKSGSWTPLAAGLVKGLEVLKREKMKDKKTVPFLITITDGGANVPLNAGSFAGKRFSYVQQMRSEMESYNQLLCEIEEIAKMFRKEEIRTVVIRPESHALMKNWRKKICQSLAEKSGGNIYNISEIEKLGDVLRYELRVNR